MANSTLLPEDYDALKKEYLILRKELDSTKQELYDKQREIKRLTALDLDYQTEIDILQSEEIKRKEKLQEQILHYEETVNVLRSRHNEKLQELELELFRKDELIVALQCEIDLLKATNVSVTSKEDTYKLIEEIHVLKDENRGYIDGIEEMKQSLEHLHGRNVDLDNNLKELTGELLNLKECLSCKREELDEANNIIQKLNEEMLEIKSELDSCRSQPLDKEKKGNSLFAEVDDRRVYLQNTIRNMKSEYIAMKQERSRNLNMIHHLKLENLRLLERWESEITEKEEDEDSIVRAYKDKIRVLEDLVQGYKKDLEAKEKLKKIGDYDEYSYCELMLKSKNGEINDLRHKIRLASTTETLLSTALREANAQKRRWRIEATLRENLLNLKTAECFSDDDISKLRKIIEKRVDNLNNSVSLKNDSIEQILKFKELVNEECDELQNSINKTTKNTFSIPKTLTKKLENADLSDEIVTINDSTDSEEVLMVSDNQTGSFSSNKSEKVFENPIKIIEQVQDCLDNVVQVPDDSVSSKNVVENFEVEEFNSEMCEEIINTEQIYQDVKVKDKENIPIESETPLSALVKKVTFTENTVSPIARNSSKLRGKITVLKPVLFD